MATRTRAAQPDGPSYLPLGERRVIGAQGAMAPNTSGFDAYMRSFDGYLRGLDRVGKGLTNVFKTYADIAERRDARDTETMTENLIRQHKLDTFATNTGRNADGLFDREKDWGLKARAQILKHSGLSDELAGAIWDNKFARYHDQVGAFVLEQNAVAERDSKFAAAISAQDSLAEGKVGDFRSYAEFSAKIDGIYGPMTKDGIQMKSQGIDTMIESWVAQNPNETLRWYKANKDQLRQVMGREFADVNKAMDRVQRTVDAQVSRAETMALRSERVALKAQKQKDEKWLNEQILAMAQQDEGQDQAQGTEQNEPWDLQAAIKSGQQNGISAGTLGDMIKAARAEESYRQGQVKDEVKAGEDQKKTKDEAWLSQGLAAIADGDESFNIDTYIASGRENGISGKALNDLRKAARTDETAERKQTQLEMDNLYYSKAAVGDLTPADVSAMAQHVAEGTMTSAAYSRAVQRRDQNAKLDKAGITPLYKTATSAMKTAIASGVMGGSASPNDVLRYKKMDAALYTHVQSLTPGEQARALDLNDPKSFINQLIMLNRDSRSPSDRMMDSMAPVGAAVLGWKPELPGAQATKQQIAQRLPGESLSDYNKRVSANPQ